VIARTGLFDVMGANQLIREIETREVCPDLGFACALPAGSWPESRPLFRH
jgi:hypothetical protein